MASTSQATCHSQALELRILGRDFRTQIQARAGQMTLAELVPAAAELCDRMTAATAQELGRRGAPVACRKGCGSCCTYMVAVSGGEAIVLRNHVAAMESPRREEIVGRYLQNARKMLANPPPQDLPQRAGDACLEAISQWYVELGLTCPFLEGGACSIYPVRPLVCREYLSQSSNACASGEGNGGLKPPVSVAEAVAQLNVELEPAWPEAIAFPVAMVWASGPDVCPKRYSSVLLLSRLAELLRQQQAVRAA